MFRPLQVLQVLFSIVQGVSVFMMDSDAHGRRHDNPMEIFTFKFPVMLKILDGVDFAFAFFDPPAFSVEFDIILGVHQ